MNFLNPYSRIDYKDFFQNKLLTDEFEFIEEKLSPEFKPQYLKQVELLGRDKSLELDVYEILHESENDPRVGLSKDIFRLMSKYGAKRALVILYSPNSKNYRLSLATVELSLEGSNIKREYSNPRRYSFFLGPDSKIHTPSEFLISKGRVADFEDLQNRFSIEVVNKEFYQRIAVQFSKLIGGKRKIGSHTEDYRRILYMPSVTEQHIFQEFAVRLIGRLVFCWFLKMKKSDNNIPLISSEVLSFDSAKSQSNYYHNVLEKLFFEVLNTHIDERRKEFKLEPYISIPFLNGGLFNPHTFDFYDVDRSGISKHLNTLKVPDKWLQDFIEILETYNFTVDENTSVDIDLSVDPEMLGRIFENLLAEINPETGKSARKATGSYYTPRPIVEYMVDESLKQYIVTNTNIDEDKISDLLSYGDSKVDLTDLEKEKIVEAFDKVKILDPACGSGAFPIGILQKMLLVLNRVDPNSQLWLNKQLDRVPTSALRNELKKKLEYENVEYVHKLGIIQSSIYGVDIQPIASEISKLRCFLSLIVDEKIFDDKENRGILPLPNLEFKFVAANTLITLPKSSSQSELFNVDREIEELASLRKQYFTARGKEKEIIESEFLHTQKKLVDNYFKKQAKDDRAVKLSNWNPFSDNASQWFDPVWMFGLTEGFNIIIGNPPYIGHKGGQKGLFRLLKSTALGKRFNNERMDIFYYFFHISIDYLIAKGIVSLITTNYYLTADSAVKLRNDFLQRAQLYKIINFNELKIFESALGQHNIITFLTKKSQKSICEIVNINREGIANTELLNKILLDKDEQTIYYSQDILQLYDGDKHYIRLRYRRSSKDMDYVDILDKVKSNNLTLENFCNISQGIVTGIDKVSQKHILKYPEFSANQGAGVFVVSNSEKNKIGNSVLFKPWFKNSDINRYFVREKCEKWLIHTSVEINLKDFPNIDSHLNKYKKLISARNYESGELSKAKRLNKWWALSSSRWEFNFDMPKIVSPQRSHINTFAYTDRPWFASADVYFITAKDKSTPIKYVLGLLNSKLIYFWLYHRGKRKGEMLELYLTPLSEIPLYKYSPFLGDKIIHLVETIMISKKQTPLANTKHLENKIDIIVYKLYNLIYEEVKIIDPEIEKIISEKDYEKFGV